MNLIQRQTAIAYALNFVLTGGHEAHAEEASHPHEAGHGHGD